LQRCAGTSSQDWQDRAENVGAALMQERGYLLKEPPEAPEVVNLNKRDQAA
jgi:hypothetical protein